MTKAKATAPRDRVQPTSRIDYADLVQGDRVHSSLYSDEQIFADEMERIFYGGWVFVAHESEIPTPGSYVRRAMGLQQVIVTRNRNGEIRILSNRCAHRGNLLCIHQKGNARTFTCDYHGWSFSLDGDLVNVLHPQGFTKDKSTMGLRRPAFTESYRGFIFASFNPDSCSLLEHLGNARPLLDRSIEMSPTQEVYLNSGWVKHKFFANWKTLGESNSDGYHPTTVHASVARVMKSEFLDSTLRTESDIGSEVRDLGQGHMEMAFDMGYSKPFEWFNASSPAKSSRVAEYAERLVAAYGPEKAAKIMVAGPSHVVVFPNLFLGEMNIAIFQPISAGESVIWHTPLLLGGVPDSLNSRLMRQSEGGVGPSSFVVSDDAIISERQQLAYQGLGGWLDLSRGQQRDRTRDGVISGHFTDETNLRGFWKHYRRVMGTS